MPRIDPSQLLKCLSVLLSPAGGIRSKDEVNRIANLMTKFSKKLVSKCIYVLILKSTEVDILDLFMSAGGWDLVFTWLSDGITMKNWPLVEEIVELLLLCPVNIQRLKGNNCPKIIKSLSKDVTATEKVRELACEVVEQWLAIVKGACEATSTYHQQIAAAAASGEHVTNTTSDEGKSQEEPAKADDPLPVYKITIRDGKQVLAEVISDKTGSRVDNTPAPAEETSAVDSAKSNVEENEESQDSLAVSEPRSETKSQTKRPIRARKIRVLDKLSESETESSDDEIQLVKSRKRIQTPKGKAAQAKKNKVEEKKVKEEKTKKPTIVRTRVPEPKHEPKKIEKVTKQETKQSKLDRETMEKDRATIAKLVTPSISSMGRIPKKQKDDKEEKKDVKKEEPKKESKRDEKRVEHKKPVEPPKPLPKDPKKYNYSTEIRKHDTERPKTIVKTFNSKFRSTGLEETPPPPKKKTDSVKGHEEVKRSPKRTSPLKDVPVPEKKSRHHDDKSKEKEKPKESKEEKKQTSPKPKIFRVTGGDGGDIYLPLFPHHLFKRPVSVL